MEIVQFKKAFNSTYPISMSDVEFRTEKVGLFIVIVQFNHSCPIVGMSRNKV